MYSLLPEEEPSISKYVEDLKIKKKISLDKVYLVGLYCKIILQCTVYKET